MFAGSLQLLSCVLLVSALLYSGYKARCRSLERAKFLKTHKCQSTGPSYPGIPFLFGLDFLLENVRNVIKHKFAQGVHERFQRYGPTHRSRIVLKGIVNTIEPENLEAVFKHQFTDYAIIPGRAKLVKAFFGDGIFSNSGHEWKESKSLVHMAMANTRLDEALFEKHASRLIQSIRSQESAAFDFAELAFAYTLDVSTGVFFGESTGALVDQEIDMELRQFGRDFSMLGKMARVLTIFNNQFPFLRRIMFWGEYKPTQSRINSFVDGRVQRASSSKQHQEVLQVRELQDMKIPSARGTVVEALALRTPDGLRARKEALNLLLAARDTVGIALSETFYWLARKPAVWAKLRKEIKEVLGDRTPTFAELKKMGYLKHILYEGKHRVHGPRVMSDCQPSSSSTAPTDSLRPWPSSHPRHRPPPWRRYQWPRAPFC